MYKRSTDKKKKNMKLQNSNADARSAKRLVTIAILSLALASIMTACSVTTKTSGTEPTETTKVSDNSSTKDSPSEGSGTTSGSLDGTYSVNGTGPDGKSYQGDLLVTKRDSVYQMSWKLGAESYDGVGVQSGNAMAVAYTTGTDGAGCGAIVYKISPDGSLDGKWGEWGNNSSGTEKAVQVGATSGGAGTFNVTGTNADGSAYKGKLTVTEGADNVYQFAWATGANFRGTGVKMGDYLAAGAGPKQCGFVIYEVKGNTLEGKWGEPGSTTLGVEKATRK